MQEQKTNAFFSFKGVIFIWLAEYSCGELLTGVGSFSSTLVSGTQTETANTIASSAILMALV